MKIGGFITGDAKVTARIARFVPQLRGALLTKVRRLVIELQAHVVRDKLRGQVLNVRTGRLWRSINQAVVEDSNSITGIVSTPVEYGRVHEYGFKGVVTVREHLRVVKQAFGKPLKEPVTATVKQHSMAMNFPERSFLRSALSDQHAQIVAGLREVGGEQTR